MRAVYKCEESPYLTLSAETFNSLYGYAEGIDGGLVRAEIWKDKRSGECKIIPLFSEEF